MGIEDPLHCDNCNIQIGFTVYHNQARLKELDDPCPTCNDIVDPNDIQIVCMKCRLEIP